MSAARSIASMFLRRAGLFSLVLALIAGIFGMHVMNGHHIMHGPAIAIGAAESAWPPAPGRRRPPTASPQVLPTGLPTRLPRGLLASKFRLGQDARTGTAAASGR
jgi:hypothetical protein